MKMYGRTGVLLHVVLTSTLKARGDLHIPVALPIAKEPAVPNIFYWGLN
jgi:hypothetical protein